MKVAVIGAGIWGAWTAYLLQKQGCEVDLFDMAGPGNPLAGSGGLSRVIRLTYGRDHMYVDMTRRSFELWESFFETSDRQDLYTETGILWIITQAVGDYVTKSIPAIKKYGYEVIELTPGEAKARYPAVEFSDAQSIFLEKKAGALYADQCVKALVKAFEGVGGRLRSEKVTTDQNVASGTGTLVFQSNGQTIDADYVVVACGPWTRKLLPDLLNDHTYVSKQEVYYFTVPSEKIEQFRLGPLPIWFDFNENTPMYYGIPYHLNKGFKVAYDDRSVPFDPDIDDRVISSDRLKSARKYVAHRFPALKDSVLMEAKVCQYDNSRDGHFILDTHPKYPDVILATGSSGHGFKMGPAIGELITKYICEKKPFPEFFQLSRFSAGRYKDAVSNQKGIRNQYSQY